MTVSVNIIMMMCMCMDEMCPCLVRHVGSSRMRN